MKRIVLVSTFCDTEEKKNILFKTITKIKNLGLDIMIICPNFIKLNDEIIELSDFVFYTKENPLLSWPIRQYTHWFEIPLNDEKNRVCTFHEGHVDYGWAALYQLKKLTQIALTFDYDIFHHIIYDLNITKELEKKFLDDEINITYLRRNPNDLNNIWDCNLHFMTFDREMMIKIENEITLENYLSGDGVAEGELKKWKKKFDIKTSDIIIEDQIFYWEGHEFFNYSPSNEFKLFISKNHIVDNEDTNLRLCFYNFESLGQLYVEINYVKFELTPKPYEYIEIPIKTKNITTFKIIHNNVMFDVMDKFEKIVFNRIYYRINETQEILP